MAHQDRHRQRVESPLERPRRPGMAEVIKAVFPAVLAGHFAERLSPVIQFFFLFLAGGDPFLGLEQMRLETSGLFQGDAEFLHLLEAQCHLQAAEGTRQRLLVPRNPVFITKERAFRVPEDQLAGDVQGLLREVNDARHLLAL